MNSVLNLNETKLDQMGNTKLFENDKVIIWDFVLKPGEASAMHTHMKDYMWFAIEGAPLQIFDQEGRDCGVFDVPTNGVFSLKVTDGVVEVLSEIGKGEKFPATHKAVNVGQSNYREVLVEYK
ncbi:hypothetical protein ACFODO_14155 [Acinetobacter sichuanensis]|uniref:Cupin domain-containing protein n=1 Tax=Acinetobacter sichuanensis TaxID=2136183 RepID=A0A371YNE6_9GAMM|nr:hypothetical protein [Acinetobacter sichuanensis]RFC82997.1 hypothetical protein C9E89_013385 [Acinetobacter sichuanensis]